MSFEINSDYYIKILKRYHKELRLIWISTFTVFLILFLVLPKKYKSVGMFSISGRYFQNPLIKEFLTETSDLSEMKSQKESLILEALSDEFIDQLGNEYGFYKDSTPNQLKPLHRERSLLRSRIEIVPFGPSIQISFVDQSPERAQEILEKIFNTIRTHLISARRNQLENLRNSIKSQIDILMAHTDVSEGLNLSPANDVNMELRTLALQRLQTEMNEKLKYYKGNHPEILKLRKQILNLNIKPENQILNPSSSTATNTPNIDIPLTKSDVLSKAKNNAYADLFVKYEYLKIAIENENEKTFSSMNILSRPSYPLSFVSPNKFLFISWAALAALFFSATLIAWKEYSLRKRSLTAFRSNSSEVDMDYHRPENPPLDH